MNLYQEYVRRHRHSKNHRVAMQGARGLDLSTQDFRGLTADQCYSVLVRVSVVLSFFFFFLSLSCLLYCQFLRPSSFLSFLSCFFCVPSSCFSIHSLTFLPIFLIYFYFFYSSSSSYTLILFLCLCIMILIHIHSSSHVASRIYCLINHSSNHHYHILISTTLQS